jgi:hypothetical protein
VFQSGARTICRGYAYEARLADGAKEAGFSTVRRSTETASNLVLEGRPARRPLELRYDGSAAIGKHADSRGGTTGTPLRFAKSSSRAIPRELCNDR